MERPEEVALIFAQGLHVYVLTCQGRFVVLQIQKVVTRKLNLSCLQLYSTCPFCMFIAGVFSLFMEMKKKYTVKGWLQTAKIILLLLINQKKESINHSQHLGIIGTIWRYICFYKCSFYNMAYFFLIFVGWSQVSEEHEVCKETQQKGAEEDAGQQCQAGCSAEKGLMWFKTTEPVFLMACMLQHFYKNKIGHNKVFTSRIWEPSKSLELYFRCQSCIKPVCGDQHLGFVPWQIKPAGAVERFCVNTVSLHTPKVKQLLPPQCSSTVTVGTGHDHVVVQSLFSSCEMVIEWSFKIWTRNKVFIFIQIEASVAWTLRWQYSIQVELFLILPCMFRISTYRNFCDSPSAVTARWDFQGLLCVCCFAGKVVTATEILKNGRVLSASCSVGDHSD